MCPKNSNCLLHCNLLYICTIVVNLNSNRCSNWLQVGEVYNVYCSICLLKNNGCLCCPLATTGVLHCGNIKFEATSVANADDVSNIVSPEALRLAGDMWGISPEVLGKVMLEKKIGARSEIVVPYNVVQSHGMLCADFYCIVMTCMCIVCV